MVDSKQPAAYTGSGHTSDLTGSMSVCRHVGGRPGSWSSSILSTIRAKCGEFFFKSNLLSSGSGTL